MQDSIRKNVVSNPSFLEKDGGVFGWEAISPRDELKPDFSISHSDNKKYLKISSRGDVHDFGCWQADVDLIEGNWYRAVVKARIRNIQNPDHAVFAQVGFHFLILQASFGDDLVLAREFKYHNVQDGKKIELYLRFVKEGSVEWYDPSVEEIPEPQFRTVRVSSVRFGELSCFISLYEQTERIRQKLQLAGSLKTDIVVLPELCTICGVRQEEFKPYIKIGESVPDGPICQILSEAARRDNMYIIAGIAERRGKHLFNTAVLFNRMGEFAGQYDKSHLTFDELKNGFSCGSSYPVFDLDFGRIGIHICYDEWFPEVSRYLAYQGVEILFLPVAGGKPITWRTRAIDNGIYFVSSSHNPPSMIIDSSGEILTETHADGVITADLNLDYRKTNWYEDPTWTHGMPGIYPQMRNCLDDLYVSELARMMNK